MAKYLIAVAMLLILAACGDKTGLSDPLAGTYGVGEQGAVEQFLKIEKDDTQYLAYEPAMDGSWQPLKEPISSFNSTDLSKLTGRNEPSDVVGIQANTFVLFKVPVGWSVREFTTQTGYVVFVGQKLFDVQRTS